MKLDYRSEGAPVPKGGNHFFERLRKKNQASTRVGEGGGEKKKRFRAEKPQRAHLISGTKVLKRGLKPNKQSIWLGKSQGDR